MAGDPLLSVIIVHWRGREWLPQCLDRLFASPGVVPEVILVNNNPADDLTGLVAAHGVQLIVNATNVGYSAANNQGIRRSQAEFVMFLNGDVLVHPDCLSRLVAALRNDPSLGFAHGKLMQQAAPHLFDSVGIAVSRGRRFGDRARGQPDTGQFEQRAYSFGGCGAALLFRRTALDSIKYQDEWFDEEFFAYKEDIDLCWRTWAMGWRGFYEPAALAWHVRGLNLPPVQRPLLQAVRERQAVLRQCRGDAQFRGIRMASLRNQCWVIVKNEPGWWLLRDLPWHLAGWLAHLGYALMFEPYALGGLAQAVRHLPRMLAKRRAILASARGDPRQLYALVRAGGWLVVPHSEGAQQRAPVQQLADKSAK